MRRSSARRFSVALVAVAACVGSLAVAIPAGADDGDGGEATELMDRLDQFDAARSAPTGLVDPGAYTHAFSQLTALPTASGTWHEVTRVPESSDDPNYRDPGASNSSGGAGFVTGRIQALAVDSTCVFAGAASGGVWRSCDGGTSWTMISNALPSESIGYLSIAPDGALWLATGDGVTGSATYVGSGVYRLASPDGHSFSTSDREGGTELESQVIRKLLIDPTGKRVYVASSRGVYERSLTAPRSTLWTRILAPCASGMVSCSDVDPNYWDIANDIVVQPGTSGKTLFANVAWRSGAHYNGFYKSTDKGVHWTKITSAMGALAVTDVGNSTFAMAANGSRFYVMVESPNQLNAGDASALKGVYVSASGNVSGPYTKIASAGKLVNSGSAQNPALIGPGYEPGVQAWYNQFLGVDPNNPNHLYMGLEEVYESFNGGNSWSTVGRYWNFGFPCWSYIDANNTCNGNVTHSDQHTIAFGTGNSAGKVFVGNDGGLYERSIAKGTTSWTSLSKSGQLDALEYYSVAVGKDVQPGAPAGSVQVWGGLQDNGVSLLDPANPGQVQPFGGDGGDQLVDPNNGCRTVGEYVDLTLQMTTNCGRADGSPASDTAIITIAPDDPSPRFIAPVSVDQTDSGMWVAGGEFVWTNTATWSSTSGADWTNAADSGVGHSITALASRNHNVWAGWCGGCNPGASFDRGLLTNAGGDGYHQVAIPSGAPNRMITGVTPDPSDPSSTFVVFGGYSRTWTDGPGNLAAGVGHVWKVTASGTTDGSGNEIATWTDVSGNLPDIPGDNMLITSSGRVVLATDIGVVETTLTSLESGSPSWLRDASLPATIVTKVVPGPYNTVYAATYGRGIWKTAA